MIRNVVFDMGGVLLDYDPSVTCRRLADTPEDAQVICRTLFQAPEWERELDGGFFPEEEMLAIAQSRLATQAQKEAAARIYAEYHIDALTPKPGMGEVVAELRRRGFHLYLLSNAGPAIHRYEHMIPGRELFEGFLISYQEKLLKPDPRIYQRLLEKFSLTAKECLFVDDRQPNVDGAAAMGMEVYCFADGDVERLAGFLAEIPCPLG